jgi:cell division protein ZipA
MPELRWILLILGLAVVVGVLLWGRRRATSEDRTPAPTRVEPHLAEEGRWAAPTGHDSSDDGTIAPVPAERDEPQLRSEDQAPTGSERILALHVRAPAGETLAGGALVDAFAAEGLEFGPYDAYHLKTDAGAIVFTVVNMVEPGTFPAEGMDEFFTPGLTMFMLLSATGGVEALSKMVACARRLASRLDAEVLDEGGSTFTNQRAAHMREEIVEYLRQARIGTDALQRR